MKRKDYKLKNLRLRLAIWLICGICSIIMGVALQIEVPTLSGIIFSIAAYSHLMAGELTCKLKLHKTYKQHEEKLEEVIKQLVDRTLVDEASALRNYIYKTNEK